MIINSGFDVAQPPEAVWEFFGDIPQVASCLPGARLTEDLGDGKYKGGVTISMGPVRLRFAGNADIVSRDEGAKTVVVHASGADERGRGSAAMTVTATVAPAAKAAARGGTHVDVIQDLQVSGAAAQYGRGMIADFSAIMLRDFAANVSDRITRLQRGESAEQIEAAAARRPAGGFTLAARAARLALGRVLRRFFLPYQPAT